MKQPLEITIREPLNPQTNYCCIYEKRILDARKDKRDLLIKTPKGWTLIAPAELLKAELQEKKFKYDEPMRLRCFAFQNNLTEEQKSQLEERILIASVL